MTLKETNIRASHTQRQQEDLVDRTLLRSISTDRDEAAMEIFYNRYQGRLTPFLYRFTRDRELIQEAYNDVMLNVWRCAGQYKGSSMVSSWVFSIGYRACLKLVKRAARHATSDFDDESASVGGEMQITAGLESDLDKALRSLKPRHRLVVELTYFEGLSIKDISAISGCPQNTVKTRLHHARKKLHAFLGDAYEM